MSELLRRLDDRFEPHAVCLQQTGGCLPFVRERAASIVEFPTRGFHRPHTWRQMNAFARWCRATGIAIVHTCDFYANVFGLPAAALARVPVRIGSRRELNPDKSLSKIVLQRASYAAADRIVANSSAAARRLRHEGVPAAKIRVIPNGIAMERFAPHADTGARPRIITVANLRREKAHDVLIDAAAPLLIPIYQCPSGVVTESALGTGKTHHYPGVAGPKGTNPQTGAAYATTGGTQGGVSHHGVLGPNTKVALGGVTDGTSNTLMVGELSWKDANCYRPWTRGWDSDAMASAKNVVTAPNATPTPRVNERRSIFSMRPPVSGRAQSG